MGLKHQQGRAVCKRFEKDVKYVWVSSLRKEVSDLRWFEKDVNMYGSQATCVCWFYIGSLKRM